MSECSRRVSRPAAQANGPGIDTVTLLTVAPLTLPRMLHSVRHLQQRNRERLLLDGKTSLIRTVLITAKTAYTRIIIHIRMMQEEANLHPDPQAIFARATATTRKLPARPHPLQRQLQLPLLLLPRLLLQHRHPLQRRLLLLPRLRYVRNAPSVSPSGNPHSTSGKVRSCLLRILARWTIRGVSPVAAASA